MMKCNLEQLWTDEDAVIISAELVIVMTISVLALVSGLSSVSWSVNNELADVGSAFGALNQSYVVSGLLLPATGGGRFGFGGAGGFGVCGWKAATFGSGFIDSADLCDCAEVFAIAPSIKGDGGGGGVGSSASAGAPAPAAVPVPAAPGCPMPCDEPCEPPCAPAQAPHGAVTPPSPDLFKLPQQ